ncbi:hypothetical protein [Rhodococcus pyridinivorans]|uniref:hypothetical protein n=1 Tax=Rhodococcus pyridinivorans TaxID=103816 RepID=UPI003AABF398
MSTDTQAALRFWGPAFDFTAARELDRTYRDDARLLEIKIPADDDIASAVMETEFDDVPGPYTHVTDDAVQTSGARWSGRLDVVSLRKNDEGKRVVVLTYRNTDTKSDFEKLLESL